MDELRVASRLLRQARRRREWSQVELARRAGIPASQLCAYETGVKQPGAATLARILGVAGVTLAAMDPRAERLRQGAELLDALSLVDAMPPATRRAEPPSIPRPDRLVTTFAEKIVAVDRSLTDAGIDHAFRRRDLSRVSHRIATRDGRHRRKCVGRPPPGQERASGDAG